MHTTTAVLLVSLAIALVPQTAPATLPAGVDLIAVEGRPSPADLACASSVAARPDDWTVERKSRVLSIDKRLLRTDYHRDALPFAVPRENDRGGDRHVLRVPDGWLVGFDQGEFGGALWFTTGAKDWRRLEPSREDARAAGFDASAQNVRGLVATPTQIYVLIGLDHLTRRHGRVSRAVHVGGTWRLEQVATLDSSPVAAVWHDGALDVVTQAGLWRLAGAEATLVAPIPFGYAFPNSLVAEGKRRWLGLRRYVVALDEGPQGWTEQWFGPRICAHSTQNPDTYDCRCLP